MFVRAQNKNCNNLCDASKISAFDCCACNTNSSVLPWTPTFNTWPRKATKLIIRSEHQLPKSFDLWPHLTTLTVSDHQLGGSLPYGLGNLSKLELLKVSNTDLHGSLPQELGNLSLLKNMHLDGNKLSSSLPPELGQLSRLRILSLKGNELIGKLPSALGKLSQLPTL